jgi:hypothetical protein
VYANQLVKANLFGSVEISDLRRFFRGRACAKQGVVPRDHDWLLFGNRIPLRASIDQNEPARGRLVTDREQVLNIRVAQERFGILARGKLNDDHALWCPITLDRCRRSSLNDILSGMFRNVRGDFGDVPLNPAKSFIDKSSTK